MHTAVLTSWIESLPSRESENRSTLMQHWSSRSWRTRKPWRKLSALPCSMSRRKPGSSRRGRYVEERGWFVVCWHWSADIQIVSWVMIPGDDWKLPSYHNSIISVFVCMCVAVRVKGSDGSRDEDSAPTSGGRSHRPRPRCPQSPGAGAEGWCWAGVQTLNSILLNTYHKQVVLIAFCFVFI